MLLLLLACKDVEYQVSDPWVDNPPDLSPVVHIDQLLQQPVPSVDVLFAVDNSDSMAEEQASLSSRFEDFIDLFLEAEMDYHLGVIATDMDDVGLSGRLIDDGGSLYIDDTYTREQAIESFTARVQIGTEGARLEKGLEAIYTSIEGLADTDNAGFYRPEAYLALVVVSDEDDYSSAITVTGFKDWLTDLKAEPGRITFSAVVSTEESCPTEQGLDYIDVAENFDGVIASICDESWDAILSDLGLAAAGLQREFFLSEIPVEDSIIALVIEPDGGEESFAVGTGITYNSSRNSVTFIDYIPEALSQVQIQYELLSSVTAGE